MSDEPVQQTKEHAEPSPESELLVKVRDEMSQNFTTLKESYESQLAEMKKNLADLTKQNQDLQRALVASAQLPQTAPQPEKTEEQLYQETVERGVTRVRSMLS